MRIYEAVPPWVDDEGERSTFCASKREAIKLARAWAAQASCQEPPAYVNAIDTARSLRARALIAAVANGRKWIAQQRIIATFEGGLE